MVKLDRSLISSIGKFTFTSYGSEDFLLKLRSPNSYIPGSRVYPVDNAALYYVSCIPTNSLFDNSILKTISSRSLHSFFLFFYLNFTSIMVR